jgi:drug/metabolite transporter (DMT)-like permease
VIGYTTPIVAVVLGVALLDERLTASAIAGVVLILAGSHLATRNPESRRARPIRRRTEVPGQPR